MSAQVLLFSKNAEIKEKKEKQEYFQEKLSLKPRFLRDTANFLLLNVPKGKPNRKRKDKTEPEYVSQPGQKGITCQYYTLKIHAMMQEGYLKTQNTEKRKFASEYRRDLSLIHNKYDLVAALMNAFREKKVDMENKKQLLKKFKEDLKTLAEKPHSPENMAKTFNPRQAVREFIEAFEQSTEKDINVFFKHSRTNEIIGCALTFLRLIDLDPIEAFRTHENFVGSVFTGLVRANLEDYDNMELGEKYGLTVGAAQDELNKLYNVRPQSWNPFADDIGVLMQLIKTNRMPVLAAGYFGVDYYRSPSKRIANVGHYEVHGFPPGSRMDNIDSLEAHNIAVIGVEKNTDSTSKTTGWVYYIDPRDASSTDKEASRRIYKLTYETFCQVLKNAYGMPVPKHLKPKKLKYLYG